MLLSDWLPAKGALLTTDACKRETEEFDATPEM